MSSPVNNDIYRHKTDAYFNLARKELLALIPTDKRGGKMLEIGAGTGATLHYALDYGYTEKAYGIELCALEGDYHTQRFEAFEIGNIETMALTYHEKYFDIIVLADVLEHLINPAAVLQKLSNVLKDDGVLLFCMPNACHYSILYTLAIKQNFHYADSGILDRTHLRFFCKKNIRQLFTANGFAFDTFISNITLLNSRSNILNRLTFGCFETYLSAQYYGCVHKK